MKKTLLAATIAVIGSSEVSANHYLQTADQQVVDAINEMVQFLGQGCNSGNAAACNAVFVLQQQAHLMLSAGYDCQQQGIQQACQFYNQNYAQLEQAYTQLSAVAQNGGLMQNTGGGQGMGMSHQQRMQQIHDFGVQNTANYNARQAQNDRNHQQFLEMIRQ